MRPIHHYQEALTKFSSQLQFNQEKRKMANLVASTVGVLLDKVISVTADRKYLVLGILGFYKDLEDLHNYAKDVRAVLADAKNKQSQNSTVLRWLQKVERVAREASNFLDELLYESLHRHVKSRNKSNETKVCLFFSLCKHEISFRWRMGSKVRDINSKLKIFSLEATASVGLISRSRAYGQKTDSEPLRFVAGRTNEISDIVERLLMHCLEESVAVLPITGIGGVGKTGVAKSIYNDEKINGLFRKKSWVCVSDKFDVMDVFRGILESLRGARVEQSGRYALLQQIQNELNRERFLFVVDDLRNEDAPLWDDFYNSLVAINTASGSCCIVTTSLTITANLVSSISPLVLGKLSDDDCWSIFTRMVETFPKN